MKKGKFYISTCEEFEKDSVFTLYSLEDIDKKFSLIKIAKIKAILIDRIILELKYDLITENKEKIFNCFKEISFEEAKRLVDNTDALLSKDIFNR